MNYSFTQTADFSAIGSYNLTATTSLPGDADTSNDSSSTVITHNMCEPESSCGYGDAIYHLILNDLDNTSDCGETGYQNFMDQTAHLNTGETYDLTISTGYGNEHVRVWIDFNDDFTLTSDEIIVNDYIIAEGQSSGDYTETMDFPIPSDATSGQHLMRVKLNWNNPVPDDACEGTTFGETEDYTVEINSIGVTDNVLNQASLIVSTEDNNIFNIRLTNVESTEKMNLTVHNIMGQKLLDYRLDNQNGEYQYLLDMSYADTGVYLVRIGNENGGKIKKIIVE
jgi:hypothetical protein